MAAGTSAGTTIGISAASPSTFDEAGFGALVYSTIGEPTGITGQLGRLYTLVTHLALARRGVQKFKGSFNPGNFTLPLALDYADAGQDVARAAVNSDSNHSFKITFPSGDVLYCQGLVMGFPPAVEGPDNMRTGTITVEVTVSAGGVDWVLDEA